MAAQRTEGRTRLQRLAATLLLEQLSVVPMSLSLPQKPSAALVLGVLVRWHTHCQVSLSSACALHKPACLCSLCWKLCSSFACTNLLFNCDHLVCFRLLKHVTSRRSSRGTGQSYTRCTAGEPQRCREMPSRHGVRLLQLRRRRMPRSGR